MIGNPHIARAEILIGQHRYDMADVELRQALTSDPDNAMAHAWLAICLREREQFTEATMEARMAVGLAPDDAETHYVLATVYSQRNMAKEAKLSLDEAIRLDPADPRYWGQMAALHQDAKRYRSALECAERGLRLDPENSVCTNIRAMALRGLGQKDEAGDAVEAALARNPENAISHANMGWNMLHQSKPKQALEHFREALRLQPDLEWARAGIVEALKARWLPYRLILRYFLFMSRMTSRVQWFIIIGAYLGYQVIQTVSKNNPAIGKYLWPIAWAYLAFVISTWLAAPFFNLMLRLSRFGRHVLSPHESISATAFGASMFPPLICGILWLNTDREEWGYTAILLLPVMVAIAMTAHGKQERGRIVRWSWAGLVALATIPVVALLWIAGPKDKVLNGLLSIGIIGLLLMGPLSVWVSNIAGSLPEKRRN